jgi:hypothetical protein
VVPWKLGASASSGRAGPRGHATGHTAGHVTGSKACRLLPESGKGSFAYRAGYSWILVPGSSFLGIS